LEFQSALPGFQYNEQVFQFLVVQLANFDTAVVSSANRDSFALVREAQEKVAQTVPNCGIATAVDIGMAGNIHPRTSRKSGAGSRRWRSSRSMARRWRSAGYSTRALSLKAARAVVRFAEGSEPLVLKGNGSFKIAVEDRKFVFATAILKGDAVEVSAPSFAQPVAVRYAFLNAPEMSLFDAEGGRKADVTREE